MSSQWGSLGLGICEPADPKQSVPLRAGVCADGMGRGEPAFCPAMLGRVIDNSAYSQPCSEARRARVPGEEGWKSVAGSVDRYLIQPAVRVNFLVSVINWDLPFDSASLLSPLPVSSEGENTDRQEGTEGPSSELEVFSWQNLP